MPKILVADDSQFMRKIIMKTLSGNSFDEASDGEEAVQKFKKGKYDLVILDIIMENSGIDALKSIMKLDKNTKVIMVTAVGQEAMIAEATKIGAKGYIVKPFDSGNLKSTVDKVLKSK
jgi:two-component system, chemotaxis family, chemotaxis protein CheY